MSNSKAVRKVAFFFPDALALENFLNRVSVMEAADSYFWIPNPHEKRGHKARLWSLFYRAILVNNPDFFYHMPAGSHAITEKVSAKYDICSPFSHVFYQVCADVIIGLLDVFDQYRADNKCWTTVQLQNRILSVKQMGRGGDDFWPIDPNDQDMDDAAPVAGILEALERISNKAAAFRLSIEQGESHNAEISEEL